MVDQTILQAEKKAASELFANGDIWLAGKSEPRPLLSLSLISGKRNLAALRIGLSVHRNLQCSCLHSETLCLG